MLFFTRHFLFQNYFRHNFFIKPICKTVPSHIITKLEQSTIVKFINLLLYKLFQKFYSQILHNRNHIGLASVKGNIYLSSYISIHKGLYKLKLIFIKYFFSSSYPNCQLFIIRKGYDYYYYEALSVNQHRTCIPVYVSLLF